MNKLSLTRLFFWMVLPGVLMLSACGDEPTVDTPVDPDLNLVSDHKADVSVQWNEVFLKVERYAQGYRPGPAPRSLAYMGLAAYEACITGMPEYNTLENHWA
jgi:hypothetical protein